MGRAAYADADWAERTRARLRRDAARLDRMLVAAGFDIVGGTSLFRLARAPDAQARARRLAGQGVLVRTFDHDPTLIRFGLPGRNHWRRLQTVLETSR
jgi:cobalamin biosynthesis protein CobC